MRFKLILAYSRSCITGFVDACGLLVALFRRQSAVKVSALTVEGGGTGRIKFNILGIDNLGSAIFLIAVPDLRRVMPGFLGCWGDAGGCGLARRSRYVGGMDSHNKALLRNFHLMISDSSQFL